MVAGFLVAIKQLMPDQEITAFFVLKFRAKVSPGNSVKNKLMCIWRTAISPAEMKDMRILPA